MEEVKRKLASIRRISEIKPIEGADNIELAIVDGWQCVTKKGEFQPGDLCVYFEIDSFLPIRPEFEFLRKSSYKKMGDKEGFRLKTIKLKGQISQGLVLGITYPQIFENDRIIPTLLEGYDLTEKLGVIKYEQPIPASLAGQVKGDFPSFIRKTDLERVQNIWNDIKDDDEHYEVSLKLDGTSCTFYLNDGVFGVCSRNLDLQETEGNIYWKMARKYDIENVLRGLDRNLAFQGEIIGHGIQTNHEGLHNQEFYLFDIWDIDNQCYLPPFVRRDLLKRLKSMGVSLACIPCPIISPLGQCPTVELTNISLKMFNGNIQEILDLANGRSLHAKTREGIVFKNSSRRFKVISNEYLLKEKH